jgi:hypothetical protein
MHDLDGNRNLVVGTHAPIDDKRRLRDSPIGGPQERASLKILVRGAERDPDAMTLDRRLDLYEGGELNIEGLWEGDPVSTFEIKQVAVSMMREIRRRSKSR